MALARVVSFEGVSTERVRQLEQEMSSQEQPEGLRAKEMLMLHDPGSEKSLVILLFDNETDYAEGDAVLSAMPAPDTPGRRTSVAKYEVAIHMKA